MPIFAGISDEQLSALVAQADEMELPAGGVLFREGDPPQGLYVILQGEVEIVKRAGAQTVVIANVPAGSFVGEISLSSGCLIPRSVVPPKPAAFSDHADVFRHITELPIAQLILVTMVQRLRDTELQVQQQQKLSALGKMAAGLAHELNNPAAANRSAATHLPETLAAQQAQMLKLQAAHLSSEHLSFLELQGELIARGAGGSTLSPLALLRPRRKPHELARRCRS